MDCLQKLHLFVLIVFYHFTEVELVPQLQVPTQVPGHVVGVAIRVGDADGTDCWLAWVELRYMLEKALSSEVCLLAQWTFVSASVDCRLVLLLGHHLRLDDALSHLVADLAVFSMVLSLDKIDQVVAWSLDELLLHLSKQRLIWQLLRLAYALLAFWTFDWIFPTLDPLKALSTENRIADLVPHWPFRNGHANEALVIFLVGDWA